MTTYLTDALLADQLPKLPARTRFRLDIYGQCFLVHVVDNKTGMPVRTVLQGQITDVTTAEIQAFKSNGNEVVQE